MPINQVQGRENKNHPKDITLENHESPQSRKGFLPLRLCGDS
jgi:hypothetical protein